MTTSDLRAWLRAELADDREAIADKSATDWLVTVVDTVLALVVVIRLSATSWVWAINYGDGVADLNYSYTGPYARAARWSLVDRLQVSVLCAWLPIFMYHAFGFDGPAWAELVVGTQAVVLMLEPVRVGARVLYDEVSQ